ncbi:MAG: ABC transporter permease [Elusimicrobia bacterium]|nr:ABC transporter permease [Elusimicrobiota bacterium]
MTKLATVITTSLLEIWAHKLRSLLSFLTMAIGVGAILYTFAITEGTSQRMKKAMAIAGQGRMEIGPKRGGDYKSKGLSPGLTLNDAKAIRSAFPELAMVSPEIERWGAGFIYKDFKDGSLAARGITLEWAKRDWGYTTRGRFLNQTDIDTAARVCVLIEPGRWLKKPWWIKRWASRKDDFNSWIVRRDLLGKNVIIGNEMFLVVGIIQEPTREKDPRWFRGRWSWGDGLMPITTLMKSVTSRYDASDSPDKIDSIDIDTGNEETVSSYRKKIEALMRLRHRGEEDFEVFEYRERYADQIAEQKKTARATLLMGIICVLAGGIGIMNVTLATIYSRIKEIGIRRAVGASRSDIVLQFVIEAMLLGLLGGIFGIALGLLGINTFLKDIRWMDIATFHPIHFMAALTIAVGTGFIFSIWPAWMAAKLDPVEALRYE